MALPDIPRILSRISTRTFFALLLVLFVGVSVQYTIKALDVRDGKQDRSAILRWREQLLMLDEGENIYLRHNYPNPPIMALLLRPLADLPPIAGGLIWYYLKVGMVLATFAMAFRLVEEPGRPMPSWAAMLTVLMSLRPILGDLTHGNVNLFILFLVIASLMAFCRGLDITAGVIMALAIACKVTPALFVVYFLWKRAWRTLAGVALGLALFFVLVPAAALGWQANAELLMSWVNQMITPFVVGGVVTSEHPNQSLPGLVHRLLTFSPSFSIYVNDVYTPTRYDNFVALEPRIAAWIIKGCMVVFALVAASCCRTRTKPRQRTALAAEYALVVLGMLLFSERTWKHHAVTLVLPFAVLSYAMAINYASEISRDRGIWRLLVTSLVIVQVAIASTSTGLMPDSWAKLCQVYGAFTWGFIWLAVVLVYLLHSEVLAPTGFVGSVNALSPRQKPASSAA